MVGAALRTGICFLRVHELVVDDIPDGGASSSQAFWLRSIDGVHRPDLDELICHGSSSPE